MSGQGTSAEHPLDVRGQRLFGEGPAIGDHVRWVHPLHENPQEVGVVVAAWLMGSLPTYRVAWPGGRSRTVGPDHLVRALAPTPEPAPVRNAAGKARAHLAAARLDDVEGFAGRELHVHAAVAQALLAVAEAIKVREWAGEQVRPPP